jgi:hypothetical protein
MDAFTLPAETLEKLGLNGDWSEKEEPEKPDVEPEENQEVDKPEEEPAEIEEKKEPETGDSTSGDFDFDKELQGILVKYTDPDSKKQLLKDLSNHEKFTASNTQRAQELAEARRIFDSEREELNKLTDRTRAKELREIIDSLGDERLAELDAHFADPDDPYDDGRDKNVLRRVVEAIKTGEDAVQVSEAEKALYEEKSRLQVERELLELSKMTGESYDLSKPTEELDALADMAVQRGVDLITAYKLREYEGSKSELAKLRDELKSANKQLNEYRKKHPDMGVGAVSGKGSRREEYPSGSFEEATMSLRKQFGLGE